MLDFPLTSTWRASFSSWGNSMAETRRGKSTSLYKECMREGKDQRWTAVLTSGSLCMLQGNVIFFLYRSVRTISIVARRERGKGQFATYILRMQASSHRSHISFPNDMSSKTAIKMGWSRQHTGSERGWDLYIVRRCKQVAKKRLTLSDVAEKPCCGSNKRALNNIQSILRSRHSRQGRRFKADAKCMIRHKYCQTVDRCWSIKYVLQNPYLFLVRSEDLKYYTRVYAEITPNVEFRFIIRLSRLIESY